MSAWDPIPQGLEIIIKTIKEMIFSKWTFALMGGNDSGHQKIMDTDTLRRVLSQRVFLSKDYYGQERKKCFTRRRQKEKKE
jgi:hypothetical protein